MASFERRTIIAGNKHIFSAPPRVTLVNAFASPFDNAVAAARTCYSSKVIWPEDVSRDEASRERRDAIAKSIYEAGHHTTIQHPTFQFVLENISRQFIWSFLHSHPFYNSEQVSQRYVSVKPNACFVPTLSEPMQRIYQAAMEAQMTCYQDLVGCLMPTTSDAFFKVFPAREKKADQHQGAIKKRAQEVARYALPIGTFAHLYHTISGVTLHRYHRICQMLDVPYETQAVVQAMVDAVACVDPDFIASFEESLPLESTHEYKALAKHGQLGNIRAFRAEFDNDLEGRTSRLCDYSAYGEKNLARAVRSVLGLTETQMDYRAAIALVLSPVENPYLSGSLNLNSMGKISRAMVHVHYTFQKKISHTADSQDQRHRTVPGSRPLLAAHYAGGEPDVIVPPLLAKSPQALDLFMSTMRSTWKAIDRLIDGGVEPTDALYLLPNAFPIRFYESGDLMGLHHKWTTRLCYTAQEEIWQASLDEVQQVAAVHPTIGRYLQAPCWLRKEAGIKPLCPEGQRFCGVPVWKLDRSAFERLI